MAASGWPWASAMAQPPMPPIAIGTKVTYTSSRSGLAFQMEVMAHDAGTNSYDLSGVGPNAGGKKRGAAAAQVSLEIATEKPAEKCLPGSLPESEKAAPGDQLARGSEGEDVAAVPTPDTEPTDEMATFANRTAEFLLCMQQLAVGSNKSLIRKVDTKQNTADLGTKYIVRGDFERLRALSGLARPAGVEAVEPPEDRTAEESARELTQLRAGRPLALVLDDRRPRRVFASCLAGLAKLVSQGASFEQALVVKTSPEECATTVYDREPTHGMSGILLLLGLAVWTGLVALIVWRLARGSEAAGGTAEPEGEQDMDEARVEMKEAAVQADVLITEPTTIERLTIEAIREELRRYEAALGGTKDVLVQRLSRIRARFNAR